MIRTIPGLVVSPSQRVGWTFLSGEVAKRSNAADCKSAGLRPSEVRILPSPPLPACRPVGRVESGSSSVGRASAFQAEGRGSESRLPLQFSSDCYEKRRLNVVLGADREAERSFGEVKSPRGSGVEHFLGKEGVTGSIPVVGSISRSANYLRASAPMGASSTFRKRLEALMRVSIMLGFPSNLRIVRRTADFYL